MLKHKISIAAALALLAALGAPVADIVADEKDADQDYSQDEALKAVDESRTAIIEPKLTEALTEKISVAVAGKSAGTVRTILARLTGIKRAEFEGLNSEEEMIQKALEHYSANSSKSTEELRKQLTDVSAAHTKALEDKEQEWGKKVKDAQDKYIERDIDAALAEEVKKIPRSGGDPSRQAQLLKTALREKYHLHYDEEKKAVQLRRKDNPDVPALNEAGTLPIGVSDSAKTFLTDMGLVVKDTRHEDPNETLKERLPNSRESEREKRSDDPVQQGAASFMAALDEAIGDA